MKSNIINLLPAILITGIVMYALHTISESSASKVKVDPIRLDQAVYKVDGDESPGLAGAPEKPDTALVYYDKRDGELHIKYPDK